VLWNGDQRTTSGGARVRHAENGAPKTNCTHVTGISPVVEVGLAMVGATTGLIGQWHVSAHSRHVPESGAICAGVPIPLVESK
jgi:hypothetical protein